MKPKSVKANTLLSVFASVFAAGLSGALGLPAARAAAPGAFDAAAPIASLTDQGGQSSWLILWSESDPVQYALTGALKPSGYFVLPKQGKARAEIVNSGAGLRVYIPSLRQIESASGAPFDANLPSGLSLLDPGFLESRVSVLISRSFTDWLSALDPASTTVNVKTGGFSGSGVYTMKAADVNLADLEARVEQVIASGQESFITVLSSSRSFSPSDVTAIAGAFSLELGNLVKGSVSKTLSYPYPSAAAIDAVANTGAGPEPFYRALDQIDSLVYPSFASSDLLSALGGKPYAENFHRAFLDAALGHYFADDGIPAASASRDACSGGYLVHTRSLAEAAGISAAFEEQYFAPIEGEALIPLVVGLAE